MQCYLYFYLMGILYIIYNEVVSWYKFVSIYLPLTILVWLVHTINIYIINKVLDMNLSVYINLWYYHILVIMDR